MTSMEPSSPRPTSLGGIGEMSTPELLAKREQRRRMEAQAAALSRQGLSRRLLQPIQQPNSCSYRQAQDKQHSTVPGLTTQPAARNAFSRVGLKRSAAAAAPPVPQPEETGISAEALAKLMDDDPADTEQQEGGFAKRLKMSDLLQQQQQPQGEDRVPSVRPALMTLQQQGQHASVADALGRVVAQRQQQQEQQAEQVEQEAAAAKQQQQQQQQQQAEQAGSQARSGQHMQQGVCTSDRQIQQPAQAGTSSTAAAGGTAAQQDNSKRWLYVPPSDPAPAGQQEQEQEPTSAAAAKQQPTRRASAGSRKAAAKPAPAKKGGRSGVSTKGPSAAAGAAAAATDSHAGVAAIVAAAAQAGQAQVEPTARAARPRRQAAAAATCALRSAGAVAAAAGGGVSEIDDDGSSDGSGAEPCSSSEDGCRSSEQENAKPVQQRAQRGRKRKAAAPPPNRAAAAEPAAGHAGTAAGRRSMGAAAAPSVKPAAAAADATVDKQGKQQGQRGAARSGSVKLSKQMQQLQDAVSNSRRAQQMSAALEQEQATLQQQKERQKEQRQQQQERKQRGAQRHQQQPSSKQQGPLQPPLRQQASAAAAQAQRPAPPVSQPGSSHLQLPPELAAKVQAAVGATGGPAATAAAAAAAAASAADAAELQAGDAGCDMLLLDESDDLEIVDAADPGAAAGPPQLQQTLPAAAAAAADAPVCHLDDHDMGEADDMAGAVGHVSDAEGSDGEEGSSSGWEGSGGSQGDSSGEEEEDGDGSAGGDDSSSVWESDEDDVPIARRSAAARRRAAQASSGASSEEGSEGEQDEEEGSGRQPPAARATRARRSKCAAAAAAAAAAADGAGEPDPGVSVAKRKPRARKTAAGAAGASGAVKKRTSRKTAAASAGDAAAASKTKPKPRAKKAAQRNNFRRHKTGASGYGYSFMSKGAAKKGNKKYSFKSVKNGRVIMARRQAPHMAGQGAEFMEGFAGSGGGGGKGRCFRCGLAGHWEDDCPMEAARVAEQEAELAEWMRDNPDAEEAQRVAGGNGDGYRTTTAAAGAAAAAGPDAASAPAAAAASGGLGPAPAAAAAAAGTGAAAPGHQQQAQPTRPPPLSQAQLCEMAGLPADAAWAPETLSDEQLAAVIKAVWGHSGFRGQQLPLIRAALQGTSMLGVLPTGLGKSLTYQLPALLLQKLVVVVSPLLSLMHDQVSRLPPGLPGAMLQGIMSRAEVQEVLSDAESGKLRLLYMAPEKLSAFPIISCLRKLDLPLMVVDEAHCMAEWGEGFRPSYFRLGHLLTNVLQPRAVLALTATAAPITRTSIHQLLRIPQGQEVVESPLRDNLRLRVLHVATGSTKSGSVATHIVQLLKTGEMSGVKSAVVYAGMRYAADALAAQLGRAGITAASYHAGLDYNTRERVQNYFLQGKIRVMVATIAFGMGLDKPDLEAVLHTHLPHSLEEYVQQVGRAGRDGRQASCIVFLDDAEYLRVRALSHSRLVKRGAVERFLRHVFGRPDDEPAEHEEAAVAGKKRRKSQAKLSPSQHKVLPIKAFCSEQDADPEVLDSCLSFLQADPLEPYVAVLSNVASTLDVRFHKTPAEVLARAHPVIDAMLRAKTRQYSGTYKIHMSALLSVEDRAPGDLLNELSALAKAKEIGMDQGKDAALAWRLIRQPDDWEALVDDVMMRLERVVTASVSRLDLSYESLAGAAIYSSAAAQETHLRSVIEDYFLNEPPTQQQQQQEAADAAAPSDSAGVLTADAAGGNMLPWGAPHPVLRISSDSLLRQLRAALHTAAPRARDLGSKFTGLVLARMVTGLSSPAVPVSHWKGCNGLGSMQAHDFRRVAAAAEQVVQEFLQGEGGSGLRVMR